MAGRFIAEFWAQYAHASGNFFTSTRTRGNGGNNVGRLPGKIPAAKLQALVTPKARSNLYQR